MKIGILAASAAALALAACGGNEGAGDNAAADANMMMEDESPGMNDMAGAAAMPASGQEYAAMAAASDMYEIESSRLAADKAASAETKDYARMLIRDHEKATADLKTAAQQAQPAITVSPQLNPEQQANMEALRGANSAEFDRLYFQQQIPAHEKALAMVEGYAGNGDVPSLKQHASTVSAPIRQHLERARELSQKPAQ